MPNKPLVALIWMDAHSPAYETEVTSEEVEHKPMPIVTFGILLKDDTSGVSVASEQTGPDTYRGHTFVPRGMVTSVTVIRKNPGLLVKRALALL